jgi:hypothetical protein
MRPDRTQPVRTARRLPSRMFVDFNDRPPPPRWEPRPEPQRPRLTRRQERVLLWLVGLNLLALFVAPIAGGTVLMAVAALLRG